MASHIFINKNNKAESKVKQYIRQNLEKTQMIKLNELTSCNKDSPKKLLLSPEKNFRKPRHVSQEVQYSSSQNNTVMIPMDNVIQDDSDENELMGIILIYVFSTNSFFLFP